MSLRARVQTTFTANPNRPKPILWEGVVVWEDPDKPDANGRPALLLRLQCGLREWEGGAFLTVPQQMTAYINDNGQARMRAYKGTDGKYRPLVALGRGLQDMGVKAIREVLSATPPQEEEDPLVKQAATIFGEDDFASFDF